jgi:hypothetical protein
MAFSDLKKKAGDIEAIRQRVTQNNGGGGDNSEFLQLGIDATRNGYIRVRLLPAPENEDSPMVTYSRFYWKNGPKAYSAFSLKNIGQSDPCQQYLSELWNDGSKICKDLYSERKKKTYTVVNVEVIEDKVKPENNGWIGKYRIPSAIGKLIDSALNPVKDKFTGECADSFNPFDIFGTSGGRELIIRVTDKEGNNSYETSKWADKPSALHGGDETKMEASWKQAKPLFHYIDPAKHKSYDELAKYLTEVVGRDDPYLRAGLSDWLEANPDAGVRSAGKKAEDKKPEEEKKSETKTETKAKEEPKPEPKTETKTPPKSDDDFDFDFNVDSDEGSPF